VGGGIHSSTPWRRVLLPSPPLNERRYCDTWRRAVTLCVYLPNRLHHVSTARLITLGGEGNALYPVLSSLFQPWLNDSADRLSLMEPSFD